MSDAALDLPEPQFRTLLALAQEHSDSTWHFNHCGCCVCFHPGGRRDEGYIVGPDGTSEYHAEAHA